MIQLPIIPESVAKNFRQLEFNITSSSETPKYKNIPTPDLVSDEEKIDTNNLKVGDKVWIEVEADIVHLEDEVFYMSDKDGGWFAFKTSLIKKIIPKQE